jgi:hypothetical protein
MSVCESDDDDDDDAPYGSNPTTLLEVVKLG